MARIYISSTYGDLKDYREAVYRSLRRMGHDAVAMEDYVATGKHPPLDKCLSDVASCDGYVGMFAWRYGYIPAQGNPQHKSITELEYLQAQKLGKPCFIFLLSEDAPWPRKFDDSVTGEGENGRLIKQLRQELGTNKLVSFFKTPDELGGLVAAAVANWNWKPQNTINNLSGSNQLHLEQGLETHKPEKSPQEIDIIELTGQQIGELREAITKAYTEGELEMMLTEKLEIEYNVIAQGHNYQQRVFGLIKYCQREGNITEFLKAVCNSKPNNPKLRQFCQLLN